MGPNLISIVSSLHLPLTTINKQAEDLAAILCIDLINVILTSFGEHSRSERSQNFDVFEEGSTKLGPAPVVEKSPSSKGHVSMEIITYVGRHSQFLASLVCMLDSPTQYLNTQFLSYAITHTKVSIHIFLLITVGISLTLQLGMYEILRFLYPIFRAPSHTSSIPLRWLTNLPFNWTT